MCHLGEICMCFAALILCLTFGVVPQTIGEFRVYVLYFHPKVLKILNPKTHPSLRDCESIIKGRPTKKLRMYRSNEPEALRNLICLVKGKVGTWGEGKGC